MVKINMSIPFMVIFVCAWYFKMLIDVYKRQIEQYMDRKKRWRTI